MDFEPQKVSGDCGNDHFGELKHVRPTPRYSSVQTDRLFSWLSRNFSEFLSSGNLIMRRIAL
jgi:hypothetical protein